MAGYADTRQMIINTLMGRMAGTEIQPEDHQAFALQITEYIRSVELVAGNATPIGFADADTVPVQPDNGQAVYLSSVGGAQTVTFSNFIGQNGSPISVTSTENVIKLVTLLWNGQYWSSQVTSVNAVRDTTDGYLFIGIATKTTNPGTPDQKVFYIAATAGTYEYFDSSIILTKGELAIIKYDESSWSKETVLLIKQIIKEEDTVFFDKGKNLFDINDPDVLLDKYFNADGDIDSYNNYLITGYIPFTQEMNKLTASVNGSTFSNSAVSAILYNEDKQIVAIINETISKVTWQSGVSFVRFTIANYNRGNVQIEVGDSVTEYVPYGFKLKEKYLIIDDEPTIDSTSLVRSGGVAQRIQNIQKISEDALSELQSKTFNFITEKNAHDLLIYKPDIIGYLLTNGSFNVDSNARRTDFIPVKIGDKIDYLVNMGNGGVAVGFCNSSRALLIGEGHQTILGDNTSPRKEGTITVNDPDAAFVIVSSYQLFESMYCKILPINSKYRDLYEKIENIPSIDDIDLLETLNQNPLRQIKKECGFAALFTDWGFIGDSLSSATFNTRDGGITDYDYSWPQYICRLCGTSGYNFTIPGATSKTWLENTTQRGWTGCQANPKKSYIIALGCNDADSSAPYGLPVGDITTDVDFEDYRNNSTSTFAGNYAKIIQSLKTISPQAKIFCVTLPQGDRASANSYNAIIRELTQRFDNVFLIDLWTYAKPVNGVWAQRYREGYHLNTQGNIYTAYEIMTYIDWLVRSNPSLFKDVELIGTNNQISGQYKVYGIITNGENAFISIVNDNVKAYLTADNSGNYSYLWLPSGTYNIYVQKDGQTTYRGSFTISNADIQKNITL